MRGGRFILMLILLSSFAYAQSNEIYSGWFYSGNSTTVNNKTFSLTMDWSETKVYVDLPTDESVIVNNDSCEIKDYYKVCYSGTRFGYHDYFRDKFINEAHITIEQITARLSIERTVQDTSPLIEETTKITTKISNDGDRDAEDISFVDSYPGFQILNIEGCMIRGNNATWKGTLTQIGQKTCSYNIKPLNKTTFDSIAKVTYNNGEEETTDSSPTISFSIPSYSFNTSIEVDNKTTMLGDKREIFISYDNINPGSDITDYSIIIEKTKGIQVLEIDGADKTTLKKRGSLSVDKGSNISLTVQAVRTGEHEINVSSTFIMNGILKKYKINKKIIVPEIKTPSLIYRGWNENISVGKDNQLELLVTNLGETYGFKEIVVEVNSTIPSIGNFKTEIDSLNPKTHGNVFDKKFVINEKGNYSFKVRVTSETEFGEEFILEETKYVNVSGSLRSNQSDDAIAENEEEEKKSILQESRVRDEKSKISKKQMVIAFVLFVVILVIFVVIGTKKNKGDVEIEV